VYDYDYNDTDTTADDMSISDDITISDDVSISCKVDHTMTKIHKECPEGMSKIKMYLQDQLVRNAFITSTVIMFLFDKLVCQKCFKVFNFLP
jgi:hypothetical protein